MTGIAPVRRLRRAFACAALLAVLPSCDDDPLRPRITGPTGTLRVTVSMSGSLPDADGITVAVDGGKPYMVVRGIAILFSRLPAGEHRVDLGDVAENCHVPGGNSLVVTVPARDTLDVELALRCPDPDAGAIRVRTTVLELDLDPDGYAVRLDGGPGVALAAGGMLLLDDLAPGEREVRLDDIAAACAVDGSNPRVVTIAPRDTADVHFALTCGIPGTGSIWVMSATPGINEFSAGADDGPLENAGPSGVVVLHGLTPGFRRLWLRMMATENCEVDGDNPRNVTVAADAVTRIAFDAVCEPGSLVVRVRTIGSRLPDGFEVGVAESNDYYCYGYSCRSRRIGANSAGRFDGLAFVYHNVWIRLPERCTAPNTYHNGLAIGRSGFAEVRFNVTCR